jgi:hypothetical protein
LKHDAELNDRLEQLERVIGASERIQAREAGAG